MILSKLANNIQPSATLAITAKANQLKNEGKDVIGFGAGEPDFDTPDFIKEAAIDALREGKTKYTPAAGSQELKEAIIYKFKNENNLTYTPDEIIVNCGAKHSLFNLIMCLAEEGDEVIIPSPFWVSYPQMVQAAGATPVIADCLKQESLKLTPEILEEHITDKTKILILNSPSNPTGILYSRKELESLGEVILKHNIIVISDEIYEHLVYDTPFHSIVQISKKLKEKTIVVNGVSKTYSMTGWRIGYAAGNSEIISACSRLQSHSTSNPTTFSQSGAVAALTSAQSAGVIKQMVEEFRKRRDTAYKELSGIDGIKVLKPAGAFYIFPSVENHFSSNISSSMEFSQKLLEEKLVAVVPGEEFGAPGYIRISYATKMESIKEGILRIKAFLLSS